MIHSNKPTSRMILCLAIVSVANILEGADRASHVSVAWYPVASGEFLTPPKEAFVEFKPVSLASAYKLSGTMKSIEIPPGKYSIKAFFPGFRMIFGIYDFAPGPEAMVLRLQVADETLFPYCEVPSDLISSKLKLPKNDSMLVVIVGLNSDFVRTYKLGDRTSPPKITLPCNTYSFFVQLRSDVVFSSQFEANKAVRIGVEVD